MISPLHARDFSAGAAGGRRSCMRSARSALTGTSRSSWDWVSRRSVNLRLGKHAIALVLDVIPMRGRPRFDRLVASKEGRVDVAETLVTDEQGLWEVYVCRTKRRIGPSLVSGSGVMSTKTLRTPRGFISSNRCTLVFSNLACFCRRSQFRRHDSFHVNHSIFALSIFVIREDLLKCKL